LSYRQVDQMEIENLYKEHSFIGWTEISAKDGLMVNDSMKWETISNEKLFQWLDTLLNVLLEHTTCKFVANQWEICIVQMSRTTSILSSLPTLMLEVPVLQEFPHISSWISAYAQGQLSPGFRTMMANKFLWHFIYTRQGNLIFWK
jgi:hypothetical protein